jgi:hypothetical protein
MALQQQYVSNMVAVQTPQTTMVARPVITQRPVQVTKYVDEVTVEKVPVQVCRMQQQEEIREVPVTVQKPVVERVNYKVPVRTCRWVQQEMVRKVPVTTRRMVYEERVEQTPVQVCRMVSEVRTVQRPRTVASWKPYTTVRRVPRTVVMRVPMDPCSTSLPLTTTQYTPSSSYYAPSSPITVSPAPSSGIQTQRVPTPAGPSDTTGGSVMQGGSAAETMPANETGQGSQGSGAKDTDPTGQPSIELDEVPPLEGATPPDEDTVRQTGNTG